MFKFVDRFLRPQDYEKPRDINRCALVAAERELVRSRLTIEQLQLKLETDRLHTQAFLQAERAREGSLCTRINRLRDELSDAQEPSL